MENLVQYLLDEATLWVPRVIGVVVIFVVFFILAKIMKLPAASGGELH